MSDKPHPTTDVEVPTEDLPTEWTCSDCTGRCGELITFTVFEGNEEYDYDPSHCHLCGQHDTLKTVAEYKEWVEDG